MAKDKYTLTKAVDIVGVLDYNQSEELVIYVTTGKGEHTVTTEVSVLDVLKPCVGMDISLKLTNEENQCYG